MSVACDCDIGDGWHYVGPPDYNTLKTKRGRRCWSCKGLIKVGDVVAKFPRYRGPNSDIEERIYGDGDDVPMATWYACETCADLYFSVTELGYCVMIGDGMTMKQNAHMIGNPEMWE